MISPITRPISKKYLALYKTRKRAQETAASITKNAEGDRNYKPVANAVKPVANNAPVKTITKETVKNVPKEIRPKK